MMTVFFKKTRKEIVLKEYSRYIFKKISVPTILTVLTITLLIWLIQIIKFIPYITEKGLELGIFLKMVIFVIPSLLLIIVPISLFTGSIFMYNKLTIENELVVLQNSGLSKFGLYKPLLKLAILFTLFCYALSLYIIPAAERGYADIKNYAKKNYLALLLTEGEFNQISSEKITLYTKANKNGILQEILLYDNKNPKKPSIITAEKGYILEQKENGNIYLQMQNGSMSNFMETEEGNNSVIYFKDYTLNLNEYYEEEDISVKSYKLDALTNKELLKTIKLNPNNSGDYKAEFHKRLTLPLLSLILSILGVGGLLYGDFNRRGNSKNIKFTLATGACYIGSIIYFQNSLEANAQNIMNFYMYLLGSTIFFLFLLGYNGKINVGRKKSKQINN